MVTTRCGDILSCQLNRSTRPFEGFLPGSRAGFAGFRSIDGFTEGPKTLEHISQFIAQRGQRIM